jgi:putative transposase
VVRAISADFGVRLVCAALGVGFGVFYAWLRGGSHVVGSAKKARLDKVKAVFGRHKRRYGARRVSAEATEEGVPIGRRQVGTLMRAQGLVAIQPRSFVPKTTDSRHGLGRSDNLLLDRKPPTRPDEVYVGDITYIPMENGRFLYLATWQDVFTKRIVGWELLRHMRTELVVNALKKAISRRNIPPGLIAHSDGGGQYASKAFRKLLAYNRFQSSMTRKDNHYDNAMAESLFSRVKTELMEKGAFSTFEDAYTEIFEYIEVYYNNLRRHSSIGYQTPKRFEEKWWEAQKLSKN